MTNKFNRIALSAVSALLLAGAGMPAVALATEGHRPPIMKPDTRKPATADLKIHKVQYNNEDAPLIENHDGTVLDDFADGPLEGAEFMVYLVDADEINTEVDTTGLPAYGPVTTDENGIAFFDDLPAGRYLVVETDSPHGVDHFSPSFLVDAPMTNPDGDGWLDTVHVYAKNRLILGSVSFNKWFEKSEKETPAATFNFYKIVDGERIYLDDVTTDNDGNVYFDNGTGLEVGSYIVTEDWAMDPYGLSPEEIAFTIGYEDHDEDLDDNTASLLLLKDNPYKNYTTTTDPKKDNLDDDGDDQSANLGEAVEWELSARFPTNIKDYKQFMLTDTLDSRLDFIPGTVSVQVDGVELPAETYTLTPPTSISGGTLSIEFKPELLDAYNNKRVVVTFTTEINETAEMGEKIDNHFVLNFNNGRQDFEHISPKDYTQTGGAKFDKTSNDKTLEDLSGAEFWIYKKIDGVKHYLQTDYTWALLADNNSPMTLESEENGTFEIEGLSFGEYWLEERVALEGHSLRADVKFNVYKWSFKDKNTMEILNTTKIELPKTGGMGTIVFTIAGLGLMMGATTLYRKEEKE